MKLPFIVAALFLTLSPLAQAEWKTSFGTDVEAEGLYWTEGQVGPDDKSLRGIFTAKPNGTLKSGRTFRVKVMPILQWDPSNVSKDERVYVDFPEAYAQFQSLPWTIQAGMNTFTWGDTDVFNPLDVINPRRYWDPMRAEKRGTPAVVVKRDFESFFIEGVYIPKQTETLVPGENSRWLPREIYRVRSIGFSQGRAARLVLPSNLRFTYDQSNELDSALSNNFALRVKFRLPNFDWTIAGYQGAATAPDVRLRSVAVVPGSTTSNLSLVTATLQPDVMLRATFYPIRMTGTSFNWVLGDFLVKGAAAYTHIMNRNFDLPVRTWENVLGFERTFGVGKGSLTTMLQGTYVDRGDAIDTNSISLARMFDRSVIGVLRWAPNETWTVLGSYLHDIRFTGSLVHSEATYKITDGWRAKLSADLLDGDTETPLGTYKRNDRATVSVLAQF